MELVVFFHVPLRSLLSLFCSGGKHLANCRMAFWPFLGEGFWGNIRRHLLLPPPFVYCCSLCDLMVVKALRRARDWRKMLEREDEPTAPKPLNLGPGSPPPPRLETILVCRWEGVRLSQSFWNVPGLEARVEGLESGLPRISPNFPRSYLWPECRSPRVATLSGGLRENGTS